MPNYLVLSTSGNPDSNSRRMAQIAFDWLKKAKLNCQWLDISELDLPLCDADACYNHPAAQNLAAAVEKADGIIVATPVYNYDVAAAAKNMVELTGSAWEDKVVGFVCATGDSFDGDKLTDTKVAKRLEQVVAELVRVTKGVRS